jgi:hypothetical protein
MDFDEKLEQVVLALFQMNRSDDSGRCALGKVFLGA